MSYIVVSEEDLEKKKIVVTEDTVKDTVQPKSVFTVSEKEVPLELTDGRTEAEEELQKVKEQAEQPMLEITTWQTPKEFIQYLKYKIANPPQFPKGSIRGIERQIIFYENLLKEISSAIRQDAAEGSLTPAELSELDKIDVYIHGQIKGLEKRKDSLSKSIFSDLDTEIKKEAYTPVVQFHTDPFLDAIVRRAINAKISSGKNIEDIFKRLVKEFDLTKREQLAALNLLNAYGYPLRTNIYEDDELIQNYYA